VRCRRDTSTSGGFEFRVVEVVLTVICHTLYERYGELKARINQSLLGLEQATDASDDYLPFLAELSHLNKTLNSFQKRVHEVRGALAQVLESDEDLAGMYLSVQAATGHKRRIDQHEEAEILMENYVAQLDDILSAVRFHLPCLCIQCQLPFSMSFPFTGRGIAVVH